MNNPKVSFIIPAYNGAALIGNAIQSVLNQTYPHFELIVVDDVSLDQTADVVRQYNDPRIKYILHDENKGATFARKTGLQASSGAIITFLDQDDLLHPEKLQRHVDALVRNPGIGFSYNSYFNLAHSSQNIQSIVRPPADVTLADLVLGFPIPPTSWVMRREWAFSDELWDDYSFLHGAEIVHLGRLFLAGCKFKFVNKALQYRSYESGRFFRDLRGKCEAELTCQNMIFDDPRCPPDVLKLRDVAHANIYLMWCNVALRQQETTLAQEYLLNVARLNSAMLYGKPCDLVRQWALESVVDEGADHQLILKDIFAQLPPELARLSEYQAWAVGQGYLEKGVRAAIWDRLPDGKNYLSIARKHGAQIDKPFLDRLAANLMNYEHEFGTEAVQDILGNLEPLLEQMSGSNIIRKLNGIFLVNDAFRNYHAGRYNEVPQKVFSAVYKDPRYLGNRGVLSMLLHSIFDKRAAQ